MAVTQEQLAPYLDDYEGVFAEKTGDFFCPITHTFKLLRELMTCHVFSEQFECSKDTTIVQWGRIDNWFGSAYESHLLNFWKTGPHPAEQRLAKSTFFVGISKGGTPFAEGDRRFRAHLLDSPVGRQLTHEASTARLLATDHFRSRWPS